MTSNKMLCESLDADRASTFRDEIGQKRRGQSDPGLKNSTYIKIRTISGISRSLSEPSAVSCVSSLANKNLTLFEQFFCCSNYFVCCFFLSSQNDLVNSELLKLVERPDTL